VFVYKAAGIIAVQTIRAESIHRWQQGMSSGQCPPRSPRPTMRSLWIVQQIAATSAV
jgi:hypothetical protein